MSRMRVPTASELRAPRREAPAPMPASMPDRPTRFRVLLRRQRRLLLRPLLGLAVLCLAGLVFVGVVHALGNGGAFQTQFAEAGARLGLRVDTLTFPGAHKTPMATLKAALGVAVGDPILGLSLPRARQRIEAIQWVQSATIERQLPNTLVVNVVERRPFAVWQHDGRFVLIDHDGNIVTDSDVSAFATQVPLVVGPGAPQAAGPLIDLLTSQPTLLARVAAAVRVGERRWNLRMTNGTDVLLPQGAEPQALARLLDLQASHALLDRPLQTIDMRLPDRLVLRAVPDKVGPDKVGDPAHPAVPFRKPV